MRILIVEDERRLSNIIKKGLVENGFAVDQAFDGEEAMTYLKSEKPDLIVLDLILPKKSGFEVLESVSKDPQLSQVPVVILSNLGQESDVEKAKALGALEYYIKVRTSIDSFVDVVKNILGRLYGEQSVSQAQ